MGDLTFIDSAYPLGSYPANVNGVAFYIGGDTPHVWSVPEIDACPYRFRLPVFTRSNPPGPGASSDASVAVARLHTIGAPTGTLVAWDSETSADASYIDGVYTVLKGNGYTLIVYGSQSTVLENQNPDGLYWGAQWTDVPHLIPGEGMTQYVSFASYDESLALSTLPFWDTAGPPPPPDPYPVITLGATGPAVVTLQQCLNVWGAKLTVDGVFGQVTFAAVKTFQLAHMLTVDGIVGPATWAVLKTSPVPPPPPVAYTYGSPQNLKTHVGWHSVELTWSAPSGTYPVPPSAYTVFMYKGTVCNTGTQVWEPRPGLHSPYQAGGLARHTEYTCHVVTTGPGGTHARPNTFASATFTTA